MDAALTESKIPVKTFKKNFATAKKMKSVWMLIAPLLCLLFPGGCKQENKCHHNQYYQVISQKDRSKVSYKDSTKITLLQKIRSFLRHRAMLWIPEFI